jgi:Na+/glutamate symporter
MTPESFREWLVAMQATGRATSDAHCGRLLGITPTSILNMKRIGCDRRTALACAALLAGFGPYYA